MASFRALVLAALFLSSACQLDMNDLYEYTPAVDRDAGDGGSDGDGSLALRSSHLIGLWGDYPAVDDECVRCAETSCAQAEADCRADPECVEFTRCVAETPNPAGQMACRARHLEWVTSGDVLVRDLNGPYGQCVFRDACVSECDGSNDLTCLQTYAWPMTPEQTVPLDLMLNDSQDMQRPLEGVKVKACSEGDTSCDNPVATGETDARGYIHLDLPTSFTRSFTGFFQLEGAGIYPTLLKFSWNLGGPTTQVLTLISKETLAFFATNFLQLTLDETRGMLQTRMLGCSGIPTRGISFSSTGADAKTKYWYVDNGIPSLTATETGVLGAGGTVNLLPGYQTVSATRVSDEVTVARTNAPVQAGFVTIIVFEPLAQ